MSNDNNVNPNAPAAPSEAEVLGAFQAMGAEEGVNRARNPDYVFKKARNASCKGETERLIGAGVLHKPEAIKSGRVRATDSQRALFASIMEARRAAAERAKG